ncbi:hypothetical protein H6G00_01615 [Leptolyngbya sp. FACHB-541]|uniref:hypothetical protein n=1 Tax=Leptolyngbya sp. FACHB-541 TaxID=2692810 RepID=UPI0016847118|nr:hypothetical protein [Leptolyngbya sp. FACHB-541]MBD1995328.1 hypothetical protein [Leptolyngbya sp. FACHB-541]
MTMIKSSNEVVLFYVLKHLPELVIEQSNGRWNWCFRCVASKDLKGCENGFDGAAEALAHFASWLVQTEDEQRELNDED